MMAGFFQHRAALLIFSLSLFLSAALMFAVQPMVGKMLLPMVGGTPASWIVTMAFFQICLLLGYLLAHALARFPALVHSILFLLCLGIGLFFLPLDLKSHARLIGDEPNPWQVFSLLGLTAALPFIALSASAPTLQRLFSATTHPAARDPYFLYAASNLGSFVGLFAYPLAIEPAFSLTKQASDWQAGFVILIILALAASLMVLKDRPAQKPLPDQNHADRSVSWSRRLCWLALAFVPSSLMMGVTTFITTDIVSMPMIWAIPLGLYLLTFVLAFSRNSRISAQSLAGIQPLAVVLSLGLGLFIKACSTGLTAVLLHLAAFTIVALLCHKRLADDRPSTGQMTEYYLWISLGGALGGALNAFVMPLLLDRQIEFQIVLLLSLLLNPDILKPSSKTILNYCVIGIVGIAAYFLLTQITDKRYIFAQILALPSFILISLHARTALISGFFCLLLLFASNNWGETVHRHRNFFGSIRVVDRAVEYEGHKAFLRFLSHGTTTHGFQVQGDDVMQRMLVSYYAVTGPVGDIFSAFSPKNVGTIGLGTGSVACYTAPGRHYTFYEIDPAVIDIAQSHFTFLKLCAPDVAIIPGDARLSLARDKDTKYDMIFLDAFLSDVIPAHLLTLEAVRLYLDRLNNDGVIVLHLSNRFFKLENIATAAANELGLQNRHIRSTTIPGPYAYGGEWMVLARGHVNLSGLPADKGWKSLGVAASTRPWTDEHTSLLTVLK